MTTEPVTIKSIKIKGLFGLFDYDIQYPLNENVLILTGPNGYGKTQVLNILYHLFERKFNFFTQLVFETIKVSLSNHTSVKIAKKNDNLVEFLFFEDGKKVDRINYEPVQTNFRDYWKINLDDFDRSTLLPKSTKGIVQKTGTILRNRNLKSQTILRSINIHLIKEQRLFKQVKRDGRRNEQTVMTETIQTYADELQQLISERTRKSYEISQQLDSSYPTRLISEKKKVTKAEYDEKFATLKRKQDKLAKHGLSETTQEALDYSEDDAKALLVYLNDLEQKLAVFDDLVEKLELFSNILNERRFTFKSIQISKDKGFSFKTSTGSELSLSQLSSGEQHEVVLLFELIFKTSPSIMVLIDEPEISLHITWQKEFLDDLLKIIKLQNFQVLIATHSPSIINDRWDLVYTLDKADG